MQIKLSLEKTKDRNILYEGFQYMPLFIDRSIFKCLYLFILFVYLCLSMKHGQDNSYLSLGCFGQPDRGEIEDSSNFSSLS